MISWSKEKRRVVICIGIGLLVLVIFLIVKSSNKSGVHTSKVTSTTPDTAGILATHDSQVEQLKVLVAHVNMVIKDNDTLKQQNAALQTELQHQRSTPPPQPPTSDPAIEQLNKQVSELASQMKTLSKPQEQAANLGSKTSSFSLPIGQTPSQAVADHWVMPLMGAKTTSKKDPWNLAPPPHPTTAPASTHAASSVPKPPSTTPVYTLPKNSTLVGSRTMSALIGRVPVKGQVTDPYPFKIIQGPTNLAANGIRIPGLVGTIWSGMAVGDMNLTCVRGYMTSVTFVFENGEINTVSEQEGNTNSSFSSNNFYDALGWISDPFGNPCLPGKFITNAPKYLATLMALDAASGAANAYAQSQTTNLVSGEGSMTSAVTGNNGAYVLGEAAANSTKELDQWIMDRMGSSFDAVYVASNQSIVMNLQQEIPIDHDVNHRSVVYDVNTTFYKSSHLD